jgi:hypothetical protein
MKHRKHGARLLGLLAVAALGVMAFAASAQAVNPGFLIGGKPALAATGSIVKDSGSLNTMLVPGLNFQLTCSAFTVDEAVINTTTDAKVILLYTGCTMLDFTTKAEIECHVVEPIKSEFLLLPAETTDGKPAVLAEKVKMLTKLIKPGTLAAPKPCILPEDNVVTGEVCFKITATTNDTVEPLIETSTACLNRVTLEGLNNEVAPPSGFPDLLKYGGQDITFDIKAILKLTGAHNGLALGVSLF